jgi:hypothetical protein
LGKRGRFQNQRQTVTKRVKDFIEISEYTSLDSLIDYLKTIRDNLPEDADAELRLRGDDFFGRRLTISYSRELTPEEEERDTRYTGASALPESEDWLEQLRAKLDKVP